MPQFLPFRGLRYTAAREYVPKLVEAALALPAEQVIGYAQRPEELGLTVCG